MRTLGGVTENSSVGEAGMTSGEPANVVCCGVGVLLSSVVDRNWPIIVVCWMGAP